MITRQRHHLIEVLDLELVLEQVAEAITPFFGRGHIANYIPALARVDPQRFGMAITTATGKEYVIGDADIPFSIQSISKLFTLILAMNLEGDLLWTHVGREPSGTAFNSLAQLEHDEGIPRNPFTNAGALVTLDRVMVHVRNYRSLALDFAQFASGSERVCFDLEVMESERQSGHRNNALAHLLNTFGRIETPVEDLLNGYFHQCSLSMTCRELSRAFVALCNRGLSSVIKEAIVTERQTKRINSLMLTTGMYDSVGNFAYRVGLPAKSGVGGGIIAIVPDCLCIAVWSPELDLSGNSVVGVRALELFSEMTGLSIF